MSKAGLQAVSRSADPPDTPRTLCLADGRKGRKTNYLEISLTTQLRARLLNYVMKHFSRRLRCSPPASKAATVLKRAHTHSLFPPFLEKAPSSSSLSPSLALWLIHLLFHSIFFAYLPAPTLIHSSSAFCLLIKRT